MRRNKHFTSFLTIDKKITYTFKKVTTYRLVDTAREYTQKLLTTSFVKHHLKQLQTPLFEFQISDQYKTWTIVKQLQEFHDLYRELEFAYADVMIPIPVKTSEGILDEDLPALLQFLEHFMNILGETEVVTEQVFMEFIGAVVGTELKEMKVYYQSVLAKRPGGRHNEGKIKKFFNMLSSWSDRMVSITPEGIYMTQESSLVIQDTLMFSSTFSFLYGQAATGHSYGIVINSSQRILSLDAKNIFNLCLFIRFLDDALQISEITSANRYTSFAPVRVSCDAKYYIDGESYFDDLCQGFFSAKKQIFITGWFISPYFSLRRPDPKGQFRLDYILGKVARAGIKIFIIAYNGPKVALNIDSQFTMNYLASLSPNIKVLLHPNYVLIPFLWSHHQKMVVIDQKIAFMGGLDIGYGRYDSRQHLLVNPGNDIWPGVDFCNYRVVDITKPQEYKACSIDKKTTPRMPWHDIGVRIVGGSVQDLCRHFIQYWNYVNFQMDMNSRELLMYVGLGDEEIEQAARQEAKKKAKDIPPEKVIGNRKSVRLSNTNDTQEQSVFNLLNFFKKKNVKKMSKSNSSQLLPFQLQPEDKLHRSTEVMMGTQVGTQMTEMLTGIAEKQKDFYKNHLVDRTKMEDLIEMINPKNIIHHRMGTTFEEQVTLQQGQQSFINKPEKKRKMKHQILRSASMWSIGLEHDKPEHSIWNAYLHLIESAKEYIYIENQFFLSAQNGVAETIAERIIQAHVKKQKFRVCIFVPALPGFDGDPADENAAVIRVQIMLILKTVNNMYRMVLDVIGSEGLVDQYLYVFSLRTHGFIQPKEITQYTVPKPVTEIIYIHSKAMIIDDKIALIGSANINDRSLKGTRDTELAVVIEDQEMVQIETECGEKRLVAKFAHELRKELYAQHFGISYKQAEDYFSGDTWHLVIETAKKNHQIYRILFGCYPDNKMSVTSDMFEVAQKANSEQYDILKVGIKGHAIPYQRHFLDMVDLSLKPSQKEYYVPDINFT